MQKVGFDGFDVSQRLAAYHPDVWKKMDWTKEYSNVQFNIHVMVSVVGAVLSINVKKDEEYTLIQRGYRFIVVHPYLIIYRIIQFY